MNRNELIFDRTLQDVQQRTAKGFYNASDMQRVEDFTKQLSDKLNAEGYICTVNTKDNYNIGDLPHKIADFERIRQNIINIRNVLQGLNDTPATPTSLDFLNYVKANNIEKILFDIDLALNLAIESYRYCGTFDCGTQFQF